MSKIPLTLGKLYAHKNGVFTAQLSKFHCTKTGTQQGRIKRETPRELGFRSPGSPGFHFTFHFRIHFHKNLLFKCSCEAKPIILTKRWGDSDLLRGGQRMASKQTSTISTSEKIRACSDILSDTLSGKSIQSLQPSFAALSSRAIFMFR